MPSSPLFFTRRRDGFTLTELLVVMGIVAILITILIPVVSSAQNSSRKVRVVSDFRNIKIASISYFNDYRSYPLNPKQKLAASLDYFGFADTVYGDPGGTYSSADFFNILRAIPDNSNNQDNQNNANKVVYWSGPMVKDMASHTNGITTADYTDKNTSKVVPAGALEDPWGNPYIVWVDANLDGDLSVAAHWFYKDVPDNNSVKPGGPPSGLAFGSLGPDGKFGSKGNQILAGSDDIVSW